MCPVFLVSNVTGANLDLLTAFLNLLSTPSPTVTTSAPATTATTTPSNSIAASIGATTVNSTYHLDRPASFQIDELFTVPGVGAIVSGTCMSGVVRLNDTLSLGPDTSGRFFPVVIKSIQRKRLPVNSVRAGQTASFSLKRPRGCTQLRRVSFGKKIIAKCNRQICSLAVPLSQSFRMGWKKMKSSPTRSDSWIVKRSSFAVNCCKWLPLGTFSIHSNLLLLRCGFNVHFAVQNGFLMHPRREIGFALRVLPSGRLKYRT